MDKNFFNKRCHYSIRKFAIGVASIMIGASIFGVNLVEAAETGSVGDKEGTITQAQPLEKLPDELAAVLKKAEENAGKEASSTVGNGETTGTIGSTDSTNNLKPAEAPGIPENETKPSEAMSGGQNDKEIAKPSQPITPETPKVEQTGDGTVELANQFTASKPASEASIEAASKSSDYLKKEYKVFPTPQKVTYGEGVTALRKQVNLVMGDQLDIYTRNRLKSVLQDNQVSYKTSKTAVSGATNIYLGVHGQGSQAEQNLSKVSAGLFDKIDAYALTIKDNSISIVGKDTDAVFYGLTTLKHMLKESQVPVLRNVTVEDYAEIKNRGFIEGYYGNPWSNENRKELMRYGSELKLTQYYFAPKDDPYHNKKWRELYPEEKLAEIRELARVGNQTKTRYVWTIHPFMNNRIRFGNEAHYQADLATIKAKFTQLLDVGVREFGVLADDAPSPVGGYHSYVRLMKDITNWLTEKQTAYSGLRKDMIFVPAWYMGQGTEAELRTLNEHLPENVHLTLTGGKVWGAVDQTFLTNLKKNLTEGGKTYRPIQFWINWPCNDNTKPHLILGGGEKFLHPNVDLSLAQGIMLNPMQQSEASKVALFDMAQYGWKQWRSVEEAEQINDMAFNYVVNDHFEESSVSKAFREL